MVKIKADGKIDLLAIPIFWGVLELSDPLSVTSYKLAPTYKFRTIDVIFVYKQG